MSKQAVGNPQGDCSTAAEPGQKTVLVIDDAETVVDVLREVLSEAGYKVLPVLSGQTGVELFKNNQEDVILCDLSMPLMDGWIVAEKIQRSCKKRVTERLPFLLITALADYARADNRIRQFWINAVLAKPIDFYDLIQRIERLIVCRSGTHTL